jgi:hypothetical protein
MNDSPTPAEASALMVAWVRRPGRGHRWVKAGSGASHLAALEAVADTIKEDTFYWLTILPQGQRPPLTRRRRR